MFFFLSCSHYTLQTVQGHASYRSVQMTAVLGCIEGGQEEEYRAQEDKICGMVLDSSRKVASLTPVHPGKSYGDGGGL